jgi:hypothetical protein
MAATVKTCVWCQHPEADETWLEDVEGQLCHAHLLEYDGQTEADYQNMLAGEAYDAGWIYH